MSITVGCYLVDLLAANDIDTVFGIPGVHTLELYRGLAAANQAAPCARAPRTGRGIRRRRLRAHQRPRSRRVRDLGTRTHEHSDRGRPGLFGLRAAARDREHTGSRLPGQTVGRAARDQIAANRRRRRLRRRANGRVGRGRSRSSARLPRLLRSAGRDRPISGFRSICLRKRLITRRALPAHGRAPVAAPAQIEAAVRLLDRAKRPLIIAGGGARGAAAELRALVETLDALLVTTAAGKGLLPEQHAANLGASLPYAPTQALAAEADVISRGHGTCGNRRVFGIAAAAHGALIRIDLDAAKLTDHYAPELPIWGDARQVSRRLRAACPNAQGWRSSSAAPPAHAQRSTTASAPGARAVDGAAPRSARRCPPTGSSSAT
jgi:hypothetical protein